MSSVKSCKFDFKDNDCPEKYESRKSSYSSPSTCYAWYTFSHYFTYLIGIAEDGCERVKVVGSHQTLRLVDITLDLKDK